MRVGALPQFPANALKYNLTWSTDGLINEYCNPCEAIHEGKPDLLTRVSGIGRKTAERIIIELQTKVEATDGALSVAAPERFGFFEATEVMQGVTEVLAYGTAVVVEPIR